MDNRMLGIGIDMDVADTDMGVEAGDSVGAKDGNSLQISDQSSKDASLLAAAQHQGTSSFDPWSTN